VVIVAKKYHRIIPTISAIILLVAASIVQALEVTVNDNNGKPIKDAVVYVVPNSKVMTTNNAPLVVDQVDKEFAPYMTAIQAGSKIDFPNNDKIRHQVYSFSNTKRFEIPLYSGTPSDPVLFEKPGIVALGCNIHDWMTAYIFVADSPYFAVTDINGKAEIKDLIVGQHDIEAWHPTAKGDAKETRQKTSTTTSTLTFILATKPVWRAWRAPNNANTGGYR